MPDLQIAADFRVKVAQYIEMHRLLQPGMRVVVGVSGGADSVALLHVLKELSRQWRLQLHVAHLNHLLRPAAREDAAFVQRLGRSWNLPVTVGYADVCRLAGRRRLGIEEAGRQARYRFLFYVAEKTGADRIAVAHHADDQVETIFLNILRGTGASGLSGMSQRNGIVVRPFLGITREKIENYCRSAQLNWRLDATNLGEVYLRNKIRNRLLPLLRDEFNPHIDQAIIRLSRIMEAENRFLNRYVREFYKTLVIKGKAGLKLKLPDFIDLPPAIQRRLLRAVVQNAAGHLCDLGYRHVEDCLSLVRTGSTGGEVHLPHGIRVRKSYEYLIIGRASAAAGIPFVRQLLTVPGETRVPDLGIAIRADILPWRPDSDPRLLCTPRTGYRVCFDYDKIKRPLYVRTRALGDRIYLFGGGGTKKIKDLFIDLKIPREARERVPLVVSDEEIYWVAGYRRSETGRVTPNTRRILSLEINKLNSIDESC